MGPEFVSSIAGNRMRIGNRVMRDLGELVGDPTSG
jgi:hypothetical protein